MISSNREHNYEISGYAFLQMGNKVWNKEQAIDYMTKTWKEHFHLDIDDKAREIAGEFLDNAAKSAR